MIMSPTLVPLRRSFDMDNVGMIESRQLTSGGADGCDELEPLTDSVIAVCALGVPVFATVGFAVGIPLERIALSTALAPPLVLAWRARRRQRIRAAALWIVCGVIAIGGGVAILEGASLIAAGCMLMGCGVAQVLLGGRAALGAAGVSAAVIAAALIAQRTGLLSPPLPPTRAETAAGLTVELAGLAALFFVGGRSFRRLSARARVQARELGAAAAELAVSRAALHASARRLAALAELGRRALGDDPLDAIADAALRCVEDALDADVCDLHEIDRDRRRLALRTGAGSSRASASERAGELSQVGLEALDAVDAGADPVIVDPALLAAFGLHPLPPHDRINAVAAVVLRAGGRAHALLTVRWNAPRALSADEIGLLASAGQAFAAALEREITATRVRASESRLAEIMRETPDGMIALGPDRRVVAWNPAAERLTGIPADAAEAQRLVSLLAPPAPARSQLVNALDALEAGASDAELVELELGARDGARGRFVDLHARPARVEGRERVTGFHLTLRDVSARKRSERERAELTRQLADAQRLESVGRLAGGIAHDFNNLLTVILANCSLLSRRSAGHDSTIAEIEQAAEGAAALARQLLAFGSRRHLALGVHDLGEVVTRFERLIARIISENVRIVVDIGGRPCLVQADLGQLEQILMNLAVNARDAMPDGGELSIRVERIDLEVPRATPHGTLSPGAYAALRVRDTGAGMPPEVQRRLFEPYFTTKPVGHGTGLGLAVVLAIVEQSGGHIGVTTEPGVGTTVEVLLPLAAGPRAATAAPEAPRLARGTGGETILVVEDEELVLNAAHAILEQAGYQVLCARSAGEARRLCERHVGRIDLLLTDIVMPDGSGPQLVAALPDHQRPPRVLYMSGYATNEARRGFDRDDILAKPFGAAALTRRVRELLDARPPLRPA
jgi:PAS domain S-box-containing protein